MATELAEFHWCKLFRVEPDELERPCCIKRLRKVGVTVSETDEKHVLRRGSPDRRMAAAIEAGLISVVMSFLAKFKCVFLQICWTLLWH